MIRKPGTKTNTTFTQSISIALHPGILGNPMSIALHGPNDMLHEVELETLVDDQITLLDDKDVRGQAQELASAANELRRLAGRIDAAIEAQRASESALTLS